MESIEHIERIETMGVSQYVAKLPDEAGLIPYTDDEHAVWHDLYKRQMTSVETRACRAYLDGLVALDLSADRIPQPRDVSTRLHALTGWQVKPVAAMISYESFFDLLSRRYFPAASFIRHRHEFDYLKEPDIFHEIFGHCPMLAHQCYADFMQVYGEVGLKADDVTREYLARLYWFTVEFGLIQTATGPLSYGGGILSSPSEAVYAVDSATPKREPFHLANVLRTPYRIDCLQPIYYVIESFDQLYQLLTVDLQHAITEAIRLGDFPPLFEPKESNHESVN